MQGKVSTVAAFSTIQSPSGLCKRQEGMGVWRGPLFPLCLRSLMKGIMWCMFWENCNVSRRSVFPGGSITAGEVWVQLPALRWMQVQLPALLC